MDYQNYDNGLSNYDNADSANSGYSNTGEENTTQGALAYTNDLDSHRMDLAIVGIAGRFPGAANVAEFWQNLCDGIESISFFSDEEVLQAGIDRSQVTAPFYVKARGILENIEEFDAQFFGIYPREAAIMDPQHRVFLETAWEALENAGYNPEIYPGWIGIFAGVSMNSYLLFNLLQNREIMESVHGYQLTMGNDKDFLPTRVSYKFNLRGPSVNVQTACSTSLVATHLACQSLLNYQCDIALAGGVSIQLPQKSGYLYQEGGILSPDGHCRAFDAKAGGTVSGNGVGVVVIKRFIDAIQDGDTIYAIIKGSAINNDGSLKVGYTAPSIEGQAEVISMAQAIANVDPATISYIETHGTGTSLGDPIETTALTQVFRSGTQEKGFCAIGSVKTNVGHLDAAAGVTGLIKTALALKNRLIPPSLNFEEPNPNIDFANTPFYVNTELREWKTGDTPRRAGISSFGIGGTNVHMILEEAAIQDVNVSAASSRPWQLLTLSARSSEALETLTDNLIKHLKANPGLSLADVAFTHHVGRKGFSTRRMLVCRDIEDAIATLEERDPQRLFTAARGSDIVSERNRGRGDRGRENITNHQAPVVFMFSGQGSQYVNMGRDLYDHEPYFREVIDECAEILFSSLGQDVRPIIFGHDNFDDPEAQQRDSDDQEYQDAMNRLSQTSITQPALFVIEYALAKLLMSWGVQPQAMIGHSIGEYTAACLAGVFSLEDALALVAARGRLMQQMPPGAMISVPLSEEEIEPYLKQGISLSAVNAPDLCVLSGNPQAIEELVYQLANDGIEFRRLRTSHAFHSQMMDPILDEFRSQIAPVSMHGPEIPIISNLSGTWITEDQVTDPDYWVRHLRLPVRFGTGIAELLKDPAWVFIEVGPGQTLVTLTRNVLSKVSETFSAGQSEQADRIILSTLRHPRNLQSRKLSPDVSFLLSTLGRLWLAGVSIDWQAFYAGEKRHRIPLPTYPFERQRYWVEPDGKLGQFHVPGSGSSQGLSSEEGEHSAFTGRQKISKALDIADWFYTPSWKRANLAAQGLPSTGTKHYLVFVNPTGEDDPGNLEGFFLDQLEKEQNQSGLSLVMVVAGSQFENKDGRYFINPVNRQDYLSLLAALKDAGQYPDVIIHLWNLADVKQHHGKNDEPALDYLKLQTNDFREYFDLGQGKGYYSLLYLAQALNQIESSSEVEINIFTAGAQAVTGNETLHPEQATLLALCNIVSQEHPYLNCRNFDLSSESIVQRDAKVLAQRLVLELNNPAADRFVAYRGLNRWVEIYEPIERQELQDISILRQGGTYLITGGLGRIGLVFAEYLARHTQANLVLVDHFQFPEHDAWDSWIATHPNDDPIRIRLERIRSLEASGSHVLILRADISDLPKMRDVVDQAITQFGPIHGVIHAAGLVGEAAIKQIEETGLAETQAQFIPKVYGLQVLAELFLDSIEHSNQGDDLDFVFIQSSLSAVLGGLGLGAYAAANKAMDVMAASLNKSSSFPWISVNWDGWRFGEEANLTTLTELTMTPEEGKRVFERSLQIVRPGNGVYQLVISTGDLQTRLNQSVRSAFQAQAAILKGTVVTESDSLESNVGKTHKAGFARPKLQTPYVAPRNALESTIVETWEKVLGIDQIGIYDDFFELGGHSLLATQLVTRLRDQFKVDLPLRRLFENPTVVGLVSLIEESGDKLAKEIQSAGLIEHSKELDIMVAPVITVAQEQKPHRIPRDGQLPLSFGQQRLWFLDQLEPGSPLYNNFAALRLSGDLDLDALEFCLNTIIQRHESLRTTFLDLQGQPVQVIHDSLTVPMTQTDLSNLPEDVRQDEINRMAVEESRLPFDLTTGSLLRIHLLKIGYQEHVIFLTMHHIVSDGWSVGVLIGEVGILYSAYLVRKDQMTSRSKVDLQKIIPPLPIQYADYASWQRNWLQGNVLSDQLNYWQKHLEGQPILDVFTDRPRPAMQTWQGANRWFELAEELSEALVALSNKEGVTLFMTLLASLQVLLFRYTGQEDISIGTPIANRTNAEVEGLIGFILNTLVMRTDLSGNPTVRQLLTRVRETALSAYAHQDLPFEMLVEALQPVRDLSRSPLFQVMFDLQVAPLQNLELPGLKISPIPIDSGTAKFDLALSMEEYRAGNVSGEDSSKRMLKGYLNFNTDLFDPVTIDRLLGHWMNLLQGMVDNPDQRLSELPLLSSSEIKQIVQDWNRLAVVQSTSSFEPPAPLVNEAFQRHALEHKAPVKNIADSKQSTVNGERWRVENSTQKMAVVLGGQGLTYKQLDECSDQLAMVLRSKGVRPEIIVGVCMERSLEMILALMGVLKAGGAFMPLDPGYPVDRLKFMLQDSRTPIVLTQTHLLSYDDNKEHYSPLAEMLSNEDLEVICLDDGINIGEYYVGEHFALTGDELAEPSSLAYVIYTSGSTGQPKGVMVTHRSLADHIQTMVERFKITKDDRVLQFASLNFDAALEQIFTTLTSGATLVLRDENIWTPAEFNQMISSEQLTVVNIPPAYWLPWTQYLLDLETNSSTVEKTAAQNTRRDSLKVGNTVRLVIIGGDVMLPEVVAAWMKTSMKSVRLLNAYGPTETTITATTFDVTEAWNEDVHWLRIPIGRPHAGRTSYILDRFKHPMPIGIPGELYLGGASLARGYLNQPDLTAEKFIPDPFSPDRLYKTGDLARYLPDGNIDFLGRIDQQVKLRGFRIELGEIEAVLISHPFVEQAAVVLRTDDDKGGAQTAKAEDAVSERRLIAFIVPSEEYHSEKAPGQEIEVPIEKTVYEFLSRQLPVYMVPSRIVTVQSLPISPTGKLDRQKLIQTPLPEQLHDDGSSLSSPYIPPRTPIEQEIAAIWQDVLGRTTLGSPVGIHDNFFEIGGHSLLATQIVARLREIYHVELPLRRLFETPTISGIATIITESLAQAEPEDDIDALLAELEQMSDEEALELLQGDSSTDNSPVDNNRMDYPVADDINSREDNNE